MKDEVYRNSLSAWKGLCKIGGIEPRGRDEDLALQLQNTLDQNAQDLETVLEATSTGLFLQSFFQVIQPFALMFQDVLNFFERAGARNGQSQWRVSVDNELFNLQHFEEYLEIWNNIEYEFEVPAIDWRNAFLPNNVRIEIGGHNYLFDNNVTNAYLNSTGIEDVDAWLMAYDENRYTPFPESLHPDRFSAGLNDAARIVMAALSIIQRRELNRKELISILRSTSCRPDKCDAFDLLTIAQNETDHWLQYTVYYLAKIINRPEQERTRFGEKLASAYADFPRKRMGAVIQIKDLEKIVSLPVWRKRHEFYGVWVATEIERALKGHRITIHHDEGELNFSFKEAKIADVETSRQKVSLFSERRVPLPNPVGKGRINSVQPDFGLWTQELQSDNCVLIVEVKHYKKRSRRNFRDALIDYANAHPSAKVILVNYGPVGSEFDDLPSPIKNRCMMIGYMNPENINSKNNFSSIVREIVGEPVLIGSYMEQVTSSDIIVVDSSYSMKDIIQSDWFIDFIHQLESNPLKIALVDSSIRAIVTSSSLMDWFSKNDYGSSTSLLNPVTELLKIHKQIVIVTDQDGWGDLKSISTTISKFSIDNFSDIRLLQISNSDID